MLYLLAGIAHPPIIPEVSADIERTRQTNDPRHPIPGSSGPTKVSEKLPACNLRTTRDGNNWYRIAICDAKQGYL